MAAVTTLMLIMRFMGGIALLFAISSMIGHFFNLDDYIRNEPRKHLRKV